MIDAVLSKRFSNKLIVATNLGFDFNALFYKTKYWSKFKILYSGSKLLCATYEIDEDHKITFLDTGNYLQLSVEQMGKILKIPKLSKPVCLGKKPKTQLELDRLVAYNRRDCEISKKFLELIQTTVNLQGGQLKITIASCAMDLYRRKYHRFIMKHETVILKDDDFYEYLFDAYYGGRTEAFSRGMIRPRYKDDKTFVPYDIIDKIKNNNFISKRVIEYPKVFDINSLYPFAMKDNSYPHPHTIRKVEEPSLKDIDYYLKFKGVMTVKIKSPKYMKYPYLPHKYKTDNGIKLVFPLGVWSGVYTNFEIKRAIELGYEVLEIKKSYIYRGAFDPFSLYVRDLYALRLKYKSQGSPLELGIKLLLNSLYGKFASRHVSETNFIDVRTMDDEEENRFMCQSNPNIVMSDENIGIETTTSTCESSFVFPILSIYTTAYSRDLLYRYLTENGNDALYCDTDSLLTYKSIKTGDRLGEMKVEYDVLKGVVIKPKMYMYHTPKKIVSRMKGVSKVDYTKFMRALEGKKVSYMKFTKTKESIRRKMIPNTIINMEKSIDLEDNKRVWKRPFSSLELQESEPLVINE